MTPVGSRGLIVLLSKRVDPWHGWPLPLACFTGHQAACVKLASCPVYSHISPSISSPDPLQLDRVINISRLGPSVPLGPETDPGECGVDCELTMTTVWRSESPLAVKQQATVR